MLDKETFYGFIPVKNKQDTQKQEMDTVKALQHVSAVGLNARKEFLKTSIEARGDWGRPLLGTFLFPIIGTILGLFVKSAKGVHAELEAAAVQAKAELFAAREFSKNGLIDDNTRQEYAVNARKARIISDKLQPDTNLTATTGLGALATIILPFLPFNVIIFASHGLANKAKVNSVKNEAFLTSKDAANEEMKLIKEEKEALTKNNQLESSKNKDSIVLLHTKDSPRRSFLESEVNKFTESKLSGQTRA